MDEALKELEKPATKIRFSLPMTTEQMSQHLAASYAWCVSYRGCTYEADQSTMSKVGKVSQWLTSPSMKPMLLLYGGVGNGKTTMARAVAALINTVRTKAQKLVYDFGPWQTTEQDDKEQARIFDRLTRLPFPQSVTAQSLADMAKSENPQYAKMKTTAFLILDDLGCEPATVKSFGTEVTPVTDLLYERYDLMLPTIVTTNLNLQDIRSTYGDRLADRFNEVFERVGYNGKSYRR